MKKLFFMVLVAMVLACFCGCDNVAQEDSADEVSIIDSENRVGLKNTKVSISFDKSTGSVVSLFNVETGGQYLKAADGKGNFFRAFVNATQMPSFVLSDAIRPDEGSLGGTIIDSKNCKLVDYSFGNESLTLVSEQAEYGLRFTLTVTLQADDIAVGLNMEVANTGNKASTVMTAFPYLSGVVLGQNADTNLGVRLSSFGQSRAKAWKDNGDIYGRKWSSQWNAVYELSSKESLGLIVKDKNLVNKAFRRHPGGVMNVFYFNNEKLNPGESISFPPTELVVNKGDWKPTAIRYGKWFRSNFKLRKTPDWFDDVSMFIGDWIPKPKTEVETDIEIASLPYEFNSFLDFPKLYNKSDRTWDESGKYDLKEWAQYWEGVNRHKIYAAYEHTDGIYDFRKDLGGLEAFAEGVVKVEKRGRYVGLYVASRSVRSDSIFFQEPNPGAGTTPEHWMSMPKPDTKLPEPDKKGLQKYHMSLRNPVWQDHIAAKVKQLLLETGACYVRLDEFSNTFLVEYNKNFTKDPFNATPEILEFLRKVRQAMDEVDPDTVLFTENATDITAQYIDGTLCLWVPGPDIAPMRLVIPEFIGLSYHLGQIDCALQGYVNACEYSCNRTGWRTDYFDKVLGPGLEDRPVGYPEIPESKKGPEWPGIKLRWHELVYTFADAAKGNNPTLVNPVGIGTDPGKWAGRMWQSDDYWLMVCGSRWAERPAKPIKVKLPELPSSIEYAYEFDIETLAMRETKILRENDHIYVETQNGFSAVFFPKPQCPPLLQTNESSEFEIGNRLEITLKPLSPWRKDEKAVSVNVSVSGLSVSNDKIIVPGHVNVIAPKGVESGYYKLKITGDCLGIKRWINLKD